MEDEYDMIFKLVIIGDSSVGKTGILSRYLSKEFIENSKATVGVEFGGKKLLIQDHRVKVQIWDTAGQERYRSITNAYYKGAKGALIVYDISNKVSFENVEKWMKEVQVMGESDMYFILIGNKADLDDKREVSIEQGEEKAKNLGIAFMETSAKTSHNVDNVFNQTCEHIVKNILSKKIDDGFDDLIMEKDATNITSLKQINKKKCC